MPFRRRVLRYGTDPAALQETLTDRVIGGCWFELLRQGGCGGGTVTLNDAFTDRHALQVGEWVACEFDDGDRWYLGRIEQRVSTWPGGITLKLTGMSAQLDGVFPGGFGLAADGRRPHRYSRSDRFFDDPDYLRETVDEIARPEDIVRLLLQDYVVPETDIAFDEELIENSPFVADVVSLKFRGEDSAHDILRDLALRVRNASWGVNEQGTFFFLPRRETPAATYQIGDRTVRVMEIQDRADLFNRVLLTGGWEYGGGFVSGGVDVTRRWRGNYRQPASIATYGERRIRLNVPWIRTPEDSRQFVREFFRVYAVPTTRYRVDVFAAETCPRPWFGPATLLDRAGELLVQTEVERLRVAFDHTPVLHLELGPPDPRQLWPAWPDREHYPAGYGDGSDGNGGGMVELSDDSSETGGVVSGVCPPCETMPREWRVTLDGLTNGTCHQCELLNGTFVLTFDPYAGACVWLGEHGACAASGVSRFRLLYFGGLLQLQVQLLGGVTAYLSDGEVQCLGANTLHLISHTGACTNWPATVLLEPV